MKMKSLYSALLLGALTLTGCTNLDETLYDKVSMDDYGKTETEVQTIMGGAYAADCRVFPDTTSRFRGW